MTEAHQFENSGNLRNISKIMSKRQASAVSCPTGRRILLDTSNWFEGLRGKIGRVKARLTMLRKFPILRAKLTTIKLHMPEVSKVSNYTRSQH